MKHAPRFILIAVIAGLIGFSGHLPLVGNKEALAQTTQTPTLQFVKTVWDAPSVAVNGEILYPWTTFSLSDGYFVVTDGWCTHQTEKGGFKVYREDGTFVGQADTCLDSLAAGEDQDMLGLWAHIWGTGNENYAVVDGRSFVIGGHEGASWNYPPKLYSVSGSRILLRESAWELRLDRRSGSRFIEAESDPPRFYNQDESPRATGYAVVNDKLIAHVETNARSNRSRTAVYSLPDLSITDEDSSSIRILGGVAGHVIGQSGGSGGKIGVYSVASDGELELVETLLGGEFGYINRGGFRDPLDPNRFVVREWESGDIHIYTIRSGDVVESEVREAPNGSSRGNPFALYGDYLLYSRCSGNTVGSAGCVLILDKSGVTSSTQLPSDSVDTLHTVTGITVSRSGTAMVVDFTGGNVHLYKLAGTVVVGGSPSATSTPPVGVAFGGLSDILSFASSYLSILQKVMGGGPIQANTTFGGSTGTTSPEIQAAFDQLIKIIDSN